MFTLIINIDENIGLLLTKIWVLFSHLLALHDAAQRSTKESLYKKVHKNDREASKNLGARVIEKPGKLGSSPTI